METEERYCWSGEQKVKITTFPQLSTGGGVHIYKETNSKMQFYVEFIYIDPILRDILFPIRPFIKHFSASIANKH